MNRFLAATLTLAATIPFASAQAPTPERGNAPAQGTVVEKKDPAAVAEQVKRALRSAAGVPEHEVTVTTHAETIVLTGEVDSTAEAARALSVAEAAAGGVRVSSNIEVRSEEQPQATAQAAQLVRDVDQALHRDSRTASLGIVVSIDERQVINLHGLVPSRASRAAAEEVARGVAGVKQIDSHLLAPGE
jgi:osmotically-inducible protein OsmY